MRSTRRDLARMSDAAASIMPKAAPCCTPSSRPATSAPDILRAGDVGAIVGRLQELGIDVLALDLRRDHFDVEAVKVFAPGLQLEPAIITLSGLRLAILETGGGAAIRRGSGCCRFDA